MKYPISGNFIINEETLPLISQLAESIPGGFFIYHADGDQELIYFNSHLPAIFGCDNAEEFRTIVGNSFRGIVHPDDYAANESNILAQIKESSGKNDHVRYRFIRKDGSIGMMDDYGHFSHSDAFGDIYYVFVQDITEQYREEQERKENIDRIMALEDSFGCLYEVDLATGSYTYYVNNHLLSEYNAGLMEYKEDFFADTIRNAELVIYPDDRESLIKVLNRDFIVKTLETESCFDWYYRLIAENGTRWARLRFVYKDKEKKRVIVGAFNAEEEMAAKKRAERLRKELILRISGSESTYIVYPRDDRFTVLAQNEHLETEYPSDETYTQSITRYIWQDVFASDRKEAMEALKLENLVRHLESSNELFFRFRDISSGYPHWYEARAVRLSDSELLLGFSDVDTKLMDQMIFSKMRDNYFGLYYVDLDTSLVRIIKTGHKEFTGEAGTTLGYASLLKKIASTSDAETAELMNRLSNTDYIRDYFADNDTGYSVYKSYVFEDSRWIALTSIVLERHEDGTPSVLALGFSLLDEQACEKEEAKLALRRTTERLEKERRRNDILHGMDNCADGCCGMKVHAECPAKSSYMAKVYSDDKLAGLLTVHYLRDYHVFSDNDIDILTTVRTHLGLLLMRIEAKRAEMEKFRAESASAAKTDFLFNMSHDIRTPMNAIIGFTNIAKKEIDNREKALESLDKVRISSDILLNLINDVLDMSRIESGKVELHEEKYELIEAFDSFEPAMANLAASKNIDLQFHIGPVRDRFVFVDGPRFDRVLINIISNAIKYTPAEGSVRVTAEQIGDTTPGYGNYRITVADTGIGMSEEFQKHMYESFSREYNATTKEVQGTGLGLSLAKRLVDLMGGTISCVSAQGIGTTFTIVFPFRLQTEEDMAEAVVEVQEFKKIDLKGKKALLVEDNALNREIAEEIFSDEGIIVETADDGQKAVNKVRERGADYYDFILMDIQMPVMNGYEATQMIRKLMPELRAPVIALSANAFAEDKKKSLEAGMDDHVAKPINVKELMSVLAKFL